MPAATGDKNPDKQKQQVEESQTEQTEEEIAASEKEQETDSSLHSISKYNFLFYMVYKVKYGDADAYDDSKSQPAEE